MSATGWIVTIVGIWLFEILFRFIFWLFSDKTTTDFAELSKVKWWEKVKRWL